MGTPFPRVPARNDPRLAALAGGPRLGQAKAGVEVRVSPDTRPMPPVPLNQHPPGERCPISHSPFSGALAALLYAPAAVRLRARVLQQYATGDYCEFLVITLTRRAASAVSICHAPALLCCAGPCYQWLSRKPQIFERKTQKNPDNQK